MSPQFVFPITCCYIYVYVHVLVHVYICIYICKHIHIYICAHIYTCKSQKLNASNGSKRCVIIPSTARELSSAHTCMNNTAGSGSRVSGSIPSPPSRVAPQRIRSSRRDTSSSARTRPWTASHYRSSSTNTRHRSLRTFGCSREEHC